MIEANIEKAAEQASELAIAARKVAQKLTEASETRNKMVNVGTPLTGVQKQAILDAIAALKNTKDAANTVFNATWNATTSVP